MWVRIKGNDESQKVTDNDAGILALLNCPEVKFGMQSGGRIALVLGRCHSFGEPNSKGSILRYI